MIVAGAVLIGAVGAIGGIGYYARRIEPAWIDVNAISLRLPRLDVAFDGYRIVHISDIHADMTWMGYKRLSRIIQLINKQEPDMVVITGDFVSAYQEQALETMTALRFLHARDGIFAVFGNHDHRMKEHGLTYLRARFQEYGIHEMTGVVHTLERAGSKLHLLGFDDLFAQRRTLPRAVYREQFTTLMEKVPEEGAAILLVHEPDFADLAAESGRIDLQLSGHSHGGQVRLPFRGALVLPALGRKYSCGLYRVGSMWQYTTRGLGTTAPQVRLNCRPEITVITCRSDAS
ncbi:metallophosphoesterase [Ktedonospora formicarum]|uniref:Putative metallophosphoesterase YkuE n=1 Tax=Ktedonospora formicarum TaxID=2778364 RepID=A0A8J3HVC0_9CHLR|nr:metallophosphoesterase [Ktedonospora formicarum]GHO43911.1 putative metallophosphoesterase YkuE [Ktedonospora formicarum]